MFSLMVQLEVRPERRAEFLAAIAANAEASVRDEPGCPTVACPQPLLDIQRKAPGR